MLKQLVTIIIRFCGVKSRCENSKYVTHQLCLFWQSVPRSSIAGRGNCADSCAILVSSENAVRDSRSWQAELFNVWSWPGTLWLALSCMSRSDSSFRPRSLDVLSSSWLHRVRLHQLLFSIDWGPRNTAVHASIKQPADPHSHSSFRSVSTYSEMRWESLIHGEQPRK